MLVVFKTELVTRLSAVPAIINLYAAIDPDFVRRVVSWIAETESVLQRFRSPKAALLAAERGRILAAADGYRDPEVNAEANARRALRATVMLRFAVAESAIRAQVDRIDAQLDEMRIKLSQLLAISSSIRPVPLPTGEAHSEWLTRVWDGLAVNDDMARLRNYIATSITQVDRLFLLDELLTNLVSGLPPK